MEEALDAHEGLGKNPSSCFPLQLENVKTNMCLSKTIRGERFTPYLVLQPAFDFNALPERLKKKKKVHISAHFTNRKPNTRKITAFELYKKEKKITGITQMCKWYCFKLCKGSSTQGDLVPERRLIMSETFLVLTSRVGEFLASRGWSPAMPIGRVPTTKSVQS